MQGIFICFSFLVHKRYFVLSFTKYGVKITYLEICRYDETFIFVLELRLQESRTLRRLWCCYDCYIVIMNDGIWKTEGHISTSHLIHVEEEYRKGPGIRAEPMGELKSLEYCMVARQAP